MKRSLLLAIFFSVNAAMFSGSSVLAQASFPSVLEYVAPTYPAAAKAIIATGTVQLAAEVDSTGRVNEAKAISGHPLLRQMAERTVEKWKFSAVPGRHFLTISINFLLEDQADVMTIRGPYVIDFVGNGSVTIDISGRVGGFLLFTDRSDT